MKKILSVIVSAFLISSASAIPFIGKLEAQAATLTSGCKSAYLMDYNSGECIYSENETVRMPIASVCKVMTLTLCFDAISEGKISFDDSVTVSENASGMGGSQVFLDGGQDYSVGQLIKSIIVCSANDSCVAMSETLFGSEEEFVAKMNKKAEELGCSNTLFANCTGLPREPQYSCAHDVGIMFSNLIKHEQYFDYSKIWLEDFEHPDNRTTSMTNTNKLIRRYGACDGGKTGFTNEAGFCLAATAVKNNLRLVSVVLGATSSNDRFDSTVKMFEYGFANYKNLIVLDNEVALNDVFSVRSGKKDGVTVRPERKCYVFTANDKSPEVTFSITQNDIKAPVMKEQVVGKIEVFKDGILCDTVNVVAAENVEKAGFGDYIKQNAGQWAI